MLPLILVLVLFREANRKRGAWWVLVPALVLPIVIVWGLERSGVTRYAAFVHDSITAFFFAMGFLWLWADKLTGMSRKRTLLNAVGLLFLAGIIGLPGVSALSFGSEFLSSATLYAILAGAAIAAMALAGAACRKRYSLLRYLVWLFIVLVPGVGGVLTFLVGWALLLPRVMAGRTVSGQYLYYHFQETMLIGLIGSVVLFIALLFFLTLARWNPVYRVRFYAVFRLPGMGHNQDVVEPPVHHDTL